MLHVGYFETFKSRKVWNGTMEEMHWLYSQAVHVLLAQCSYFGCRGSQGCIYVQPKRPHTLLGFLP